MADPLADLHAQAPWRVWKRGKPYPPGAVYVGRPTKWGNPHPIGYCRRCREVHSRSQAIDAFIYDINESDAGDDLAKAARAELRGKHLVCWCAPLPCHADVLLEIANA